MCKLIVNTYKISLVNNLFIQLSEKLKIQILNLDNINIRIICLE